MSDLKVPKNVLHESRSNPLASPKDLERAVIPFLAKALNKRLDKNDLKFISMRLSQTPLTNASLPIILRGLVQELKMFQARGPVRDDLSLGLKEYQKTQIGTTEEDNTLNPFKFNTRPFGKQQIKDTISLEVALFLKMNTESLFELSKTLNPISKEYYSYVLLDTYNVDPNLSTDTRFVWRLNDGPPIYETGVINVQHKIYPIKRMRMGRITFANLDQTEFYKIFLSSSNRIATTLHNFSSQAIIGQNGSKHHFQHQFVYDLTYRGSCPTITPFFSNRGWFRFRTPHRHTDRIELSFADVFTPEAPISIPNNNASFVVTQTFGIVIFSFDFGIVFNPIVFNLQERMLNFQYTSTHASSPVADPLGPATMQEAVLISGFTTPDPVADAALIAAYNGIHTISRHQGTASLDNRLQAPTGYWEHPTVTAGDIAASSLTLAGAPVTITLLNRPRATAVLELISEIPPGEKIV